MKLPRRQFLHLAVGATAAPVGSRIAWAQSYPSRPITMIVPIGAGSSTDTAAQVVAERMPVSLGQPILIENVSGADAPSESVVVYARCPMAIRSSSASPARWC
jgi:hypothetical protein